MFRLLCCNDCSAHNVISAAFSAGHGLAQGIVRGSAGGPPRIQIELEQRGTISYAQMRVAGDADAITVLFQYLLAAFIYEYFKPLKN